MNVLLPGLQQNQEESTFTSETILNFGNITISMLSVITPTATETIISGNYFQFSTFTVVKRRDGKAWETAQR